MRKYNFIIIVMLLSAAVFWPWWAAYQSDRAIRYSYGLVKGRQLECVAIDGTHFDRYYCLVFDSSAGARVNYGHRCITLDGNPLQFPSGRNFGLLRSNGRVDFSTVTKHDITPDFSGNSEIYYVFGRVPKLKDFIFGVPRDEFVEQRFQNLN